MDTKGENFSAGGKLLAKMDEQKRRGVMRKTGPNYKGQRAEERAKAQGKRDLRWWLR